MPRLRLFAQAAEAAGLRHDELPGSDLDEFLVAARARYGDRFAAVAATCQVWVNGKHVASGAALEETDEVALLPPVSGG